MDCERLRGSFFFLNQSEILKSDCKVAHSFSKIPKHPQFEYGVRDGRFSSGLCMVVSLILDGQEYEWRGHSIIFSWESLVSNFFKPHISHFILDSRHLIRQRFPSPLTPPASA